MKREDWRNAEWAAWNKRVGEMPKRQRSLGGNSRLGNSRGELPSQKQTSYKCPRFRSWLLARCRVILTDTSRSCWDRNEPKKLGWWRRNPPESKIEIGENERRNTPGWRKRCKPSRKEKRKAKGTITAGGMLELPVETSSSELSCQWDPWSWKFSWPPYDLRPPSLRGYISD